VYAFSCATAPRAAVHREAEAHSHLLRAGALLTLSSCVSRAAFAARSPCVAVSKVSGHISTLENELAIFSDEIVVRAREMEREALAAQTARSEQAQHTMTVRSSRVLVCVQCAQASKLTSTL